MKTLALVTKPLDNMPKTWTAIALKSASVIVLAQNGVYNSFEALTAHGFSGSKDVVFALEQDVSGRRIKSDVKLIDYAALVDSIFGNDKVITL
ncbi:hypothetical protein MNBD_NITROSPINAE01-534 [hydrothermal vent metagenome]|uniref:tRNA 5-methylaminomethyl-2-thiouridine synthase subunit TusB n=1 Tax=hydrothermal vent metagenome TaxID=652676 RepID=A0A3B1CMN8_9ZZZZ